MHKARDGLTMRRMPFCRQPHSLQVGDFLGMFVDRSRQDKDGYTEGKMSITAFR